MPPPLPAPGGAPRAGESRDFRDAPYSAVPPPEGSYGSNHGDVTPPRSMAELARNAAVSVGEASELDRDSGFDDDGFDDEGFDDGFDDRGLVTAEDGQNNGYAAGTEDLATEDLATEDFAAENFTDDSYADEFVDDGDWEPESAFEPEVNEALAAAAGHADFGAPASGRASAAVAAPAIGASRGGVKAANDPARASAKGHSQAPAGTNGHHAPQAPLRAERRGDSRINDQGDDWDDGDDGEFDAEIGSEFGAAPSRNGRYADDIDLGTGHIPADSLSREQFPGMQQQHQGPSRSRILAGWLALCAVVVIVGAVAILGRNMVARVLPGAAPVYASLGFAVNPHGLVIENVGYKWATDDKGRPALEVVGEIRNVTPGEVPVPNVVFALLDDQNAELFHWAVPVARRPLGAGRSSRFKTRIPSPPDTVRGLEVRFAKIR